MSEVSRILSQIESGNPQAADLLLPLVYEELRKLAAARLLQERPGQTLQATALVHEAWLKLAGNSTPRNFANQHHFFAAAAEAMRQILVDRARKKMAVRHGGDWQRLPDMPEVPGRERPPEDTIAIHELLEKLAARDARSSEVAKMRLFLEMTFVEIGEVLGISADTAETDWAYARAWMKREHLAS